jgi:hypothetical protein
MAARVEKEYGTPRTSVRVGEEEGTLAVRAAAARIGAAGIRRAGALVLKRAN